MVEYLDVAASVALALLLVRVMPTWWFSKEERIRRSSAKRLKEKLRK